MQKWLRMYLLETQQVQFPTHRAQAAEDTDCRLEATSQRPGLEEAEPGSGLEEAEPGSGLEEAQKG